MMMRRLLPAAFLSLLTTTGAALAAPTASDVVKTYVEIGHAVFSDSAASARELDTAVKALIATPSAETLEAARAAWRKARVPYLRSEVFRFGNPIVDDWEGRVNAWPLDEGLIDYVDVSYGTESDANALYTANIIANAKIRVGKSEIDAAAITPDLISNELQEAGDVETNVAAGYHAVEFLLWGQDLNGTGPGAGNRTATDFDVNACTGGNCDRRAAYLASASALLVSDLEEMAANWAEGGAARQGLLSGDPKQGLAAILTGMGSLSYGELAGERMKLGLMLHDPEEEQDCFSDNTHNSHYNDVVGIHGIYFGRYERLDGTLLEGASLSALLKEAAPDMDAELSAKLDQTLAAFTRLKERGDTVEAYDQMIGEGNAEGNAVVQSAIDALVGQVPSIERAVAALGLGSIAFEGSDSLDDPQAVFQ